MASETSITIRTLFAPDDDTQGAFIAFVRSATRSVHMLIYGFHLPALTDALLRLHAAGVGVRLILDHSQARGRAEAPEVQRLVDAGVDVVIGTSPRNRQILHSKFTLVDEAWVEDGSWNYTLSASEQANTQNYVHSPARAAEFLRHWQGLRDWILAHEPAMQPRAPGGQPPAATGAAAAP